jgi:hypothetical protein
LAVRQRLRGLADHTAPGIPPGICTSWTEKSRELPAITGDRDLVRRIWDEIEGLAYTYIWQLFVAA